MFVRNQKIRWSARNGRRKGQFHEILPVPQTLAKHSSKQWEGNQCWSIRGQRAIACSFYQPQRKTDIPCHERLKPTTSKFRPFGRPRLHRLMQVRPRQILHKPLYVYRAAIPTMAWLFKNCETSKSITNKWTKNPSQQHRPGPTNSTREASDAVTIANADYSAQTPWKSITRDIASEILPLPH